MSDNDSTDVSDKEPPRVITVPEAFPRCRSIFEKWATCVKHHPPKSPTYGACQQMSILVGWCVVLSLCPREARDLESCCGGVPEIVRCQKSGCIEQDARLDLCMERHT